MPIQLNYLDGGFGVEFICTGIVTGPDIIEANKIIYSNENFTIQKYQIIDRTNCSRYEVSNEEMKIIVEQDIAATKINPNIIVALISSSDLQYGMSRVYHALVGDNGFLTEVFRDRKTAEEWIEKKI
jgi:hypothetical protein